MFFFTFNTIDFWKLFIGIIFQILLKKILAVQLEEQNIKSDSMHILRDFSNSEDGLKKYGTVQ